MRGLTLGCLLGLAFVAGCTTSPVDVEVKRRATEEGRSCESICRELTYRDTDDPVVTYELDSCEEPAEASASVVCHLTETVRPTAFH